MGWLHDLGFRLGSWIADSWIAWCRREKSTSSVSARIRQVGTPRIREDRVLSPQERTLLEWLIENGTPEAKEYRSQLEQLRVIGRCFCGCPTIDLSVGGERSAPGSMKILSDYTGETPEGLQVGVLLFATDGRLSCMEIYDFGGHKGTFSLPRIDTLRPF